MKSVISSYVNLTKPTIVLLFSLTGLTAMVIEGSLIHNPFKFWVVLFAITLTACSANALNMYFDRDIDEIMTRTRAKRSLPLKKIEPINALRFGLVLGIVSSGLLLRYANFLSAFLGLFTIFFYVVIYTLYLKRRTPYNIVIGGAAGAMAPLMGWAAATNQISLTAWLLFLIIFMWTPPHFWARALVVKEDYRKAKVPMLPVVAGDSRTRLEILIYSLLLIPLTLAPVLLKAGGIIYLVSGGLLGLIFILQTFQLMKKKDNKSAYSLFGYSIVYLLLLFIFLMVGSIFHG